MQARSSKALRAAGVAVVGLAVLLVALSALPAAPAQESATPVPMVSHTDASPSPAASPTEPAGQGAGGAGAAPDGAQIYGSACSGCHGPEGEGREADGPSLKAAAFPDIVAEKVSVGGGGMPAFQGNLSPEQIQAVSTFVAREVADPAAREAQIGEGGEWYRLYCAGCHGATGRGGALSRTPNAPSFAGMPAANALAGMELGPSAMPVFSSTLSERQKAAITLYVQELVEPASPGGSGLGFIGPVIEGAVAWFALVVLILVAVWLAWGKGGEGA